MQKLHRHFSKLATLLLGFFCICLKYSYTQGYSQVLLNNGNAGATDEGPKIFKALNMDLIYPRTFNSSENVYSTTTRTPQVITLATTDPTLMSMIQSQHTAQEQQQQQQKEEQKPQERMQHEHGHKHEFFSEQQQSQRQPMSAEQTIIYVTPPPPTTVNDTTPLTTNNYESNIKASAMTQTRTNNSNNNKQINPSMLTVDNEQQAAQQSGNAKYGMDEEWMPEDSVSTVQENVSTGRAVDYTHPVYNFNKLITPLINGPPLVAASAPSSSSILRAHAPPPTVLLSSSSSVPPQRTSNIGHIIYPQAYGSQRGRRPPNRAEINKLNGKAQISDRFTPGEAVASSQFTKQYHQHKHAHVGSNSDNNNKVAAASQIVQQSYKPPPTMDPYAFPPNINAQYSSPYRDPKATLPSSNINSYVSAPSGPVQSGLNYPLVAAASSDDPGYKYTGPTNPDAGNDAKKPMVMTAIDDGTKLPMTDAGDAANLDMGSDDTIGVLPASAMGDAEKDVMDGKDVGAEGDSGGAGDTGTMTDDHDHDHDHPPPVDDTEYPTPPPGWVEEHPDSVAHDHHHHHSHIDGHDYPTLHSDHHFDFHDHLPTYPEYIHPYPQIYHHHPPLPPPPPKLPPVTSEMPPPEPPQEPRVKKYSYFYIGRKLWYIPLYFTVWFSFYVLWLILKSIARHKVNLPNHYVSKRSVTDFGMSERRANEHINNLTVSVLEKIENFQRKHLRR